MMVYGRRSNELLRAALRRELSPTVLCASGGPGASQGLARVARWLLYRQP